MPTVFLPRISQGPSPSRSLSALPGGPGDPSRERHFPLRPLQVTWEVTKEVDWKSPHVLTSPRWMRRRHGMSTAEAFHLIDEVAEMHVPLLTLTGGDPLLRPDLLPIVRYAAQRAVRTSLTALPTSALSRETITELKQAGLMRAAFWLHGSTPALHDAYWHVRGSYRRTHEAIGWCHEAELPVQINTTIARRNFADIDPLIELLSRLDVTVWNVFFLVPPSHDKIGEMLSAEEHEEAFAKLYKASRQAAFQIKTNEAQHYQRYALQQRGRESKHSSADADLFAYEPKGANEAKGTLFIGPFGDVYPSRFLPVSAGNVTTEPLADIFSDAPLFVALRDSSRLKGKCGRCPARQVCGGSRARAYMLTGDMLAADPACGYQA